MNNLSFPIRRNKARKLMKEAGVQVRYLKKYKVNTNSDHQQPVFNNLVQRQFKVAEADQVYVADITYIWTQEAG